MFKLWVSGGILTHLPPVDEATYLQMTRTISNSSVHRLLQICRFQKRKLKIRILHVDVCRSGRSWQTLWLSPAKRTCAAVENYISPKKFQKSWPAATWTQFMKDRFMWDSKCNKYLLHVLISSLVIWGSVLGSRPVSCCRMQRSVDENENRAYDVSDDITDVLTRCLNCQDEKRKRKTNGMECFTIDVTMTQINASRNVDTDYPLCATFWSSEASMSLMLGPGLPRSVLETCVSTIMEEDFLSRISYVYPTHLQRTRSSIIDLKKSCDTILLRISREVPWDLSGPERWRDISSFDQRSIELTRVGTHVWCTRLVQRTRMKSARRDRRWIKTLFRGARRQEEFKKCGLWENRKTSYQNHCYEMCGSCSLKLDVWIFARERTQEKIVYWWSMILTDDTWRFCMIP